MSDGFTDMERNAVRRELIKVGLEGTDKEVDDAIGLASSGGFES